MKWAKQMTSLRGFTIIELLIVIVIIAILAAITLVAYSTVQDRATNSAMASSVNQAEKLIRSYGIINSAYPYTGRTCVVTTGCYFGAAVAVNATFATNIASVGSLPAAPAPWNTTYGGVLFDYAASRTYNGVSAPGVIVWFLKGSANMNCGREVANGTTATTLATSTTGNSGGSGTTTFCAIPVQL